MVNLTFNHPFLLGFEIEGDGRVGECFWLRLPSLGHGTKGAAHIECCGTHTDGTATANHIDGVREIKLGIFATRHSGPNLQLDTIERAINAAARGCDLKDHRATDKLTFATIRQYYRS